MKVVFQIDYITHKDETIWLVGEAISKNGIPMTKIDDQTWSVAIDANNIHENCTYKYCVKIEDQLIREELGKPHILPHCETDSLHIKDVWKNEDEFNYIYSSAFASSFTPAIHKDILKITNNSVIFQVIQPYLYTNENLLIVGDSESFGSWDAEKGLPLTKISADTWQITLTKHILENLSAFKFVIFNKETKESNWEEDENRNFNISILKNDSASLFTFKFNSQHRAWKTSGVAIPVFSLKSSDSFGIGDFLDVRKLVDWCTSSKQKIIQILPINDTSISNTWKDSYPYNAISVFALHPIYLGLSTYPLQDINLHNKFLTEAKVINELNQLDYDRVLKLKLAYIDALYEQDKNSIFSTQAFLDFYANNKDWLFGYACFCYLKKKFNTAEFSNWGEYAKYDTLNLKETLSSNDETLDELNKTFFIQYLLHSQLIAVKDYANSKGVVLKGDIPIGINRNSVDAWMYPHLFHLDKQTGAPPDDFAKEGQNWGFPTYNWSKMAEDSYHWWRTRFQKMAEYFDAYRIDHILGFFRIWEIPITSIHGLLGQFNPAIPLSKKEIEDFGFTLEVGKYTKAFIYDEDLQTLCGSYYTEIKNNYLQYLEHLNAFVLKSEFENQRAIEIFFNSQTDNQDIDNIRDILFKLCNEVLFVEDNTNKGLYHPRIELQNTFLYTHLDDIQQQAINQLYDQFFYHRHNDFWKAEALKKLPTLIHATNMLVCGEDLGMIPSCVPDVMRELQILSLEIERMPKIFGQKYAQLSQLPYLSVCSTSTHDMSPIRLWWQENKIDNSYYYHEVLKRTGSCPTICDGSLARLIIEHHLASSSMLSIFPMQDLLAMNTKWTNVKPEDERINIPAAPNHYWRYRMHISIEELLDNHDFSVLIQELLKNSNRC